MRKKRSAHTPGSSVTASGVLLGIMLLPAIVAAGGAPQTAQQPRQPGARSTPVIVASDTGSRAARSRRDEADENEYPTPAAMESVSQYLRQRGANEPEDPSLRAAWDEFHGWADARIRKFAAGFRSTSVDVDDTAQETWADLVDRLKSFDFDQSRGKFSSWLYTLVRNKAADLSRLAKRQSAQSLDAPSNEAAPSSPTPSPLEQLSKKLDAQKVQQAVEKLRDTVSDESKEIVKMRWIDQKPIDEVKDKLKMTANQVWTREHRLREKLRGALAPIFQDDDHKN